MANSLLFKANISNTIFFQERFIQLGQMVGYTPMSVIKELLIYLRILLICSIFLAVIWSCIIELQERKN